MHLHDLVSTNNKLIDTITCYQLCKSNPLQITYFTNAMIFLMSGSVNILDCLARRLSYNFSDTTQLLNWLQNIPAFITSLIFFTARKCGVNEEYSTCLSGCRITKCSEKGQEIFCADNESGKCDKGCTCKQGHLRTDNGTCVPEDECRKSIFN